MAQLNPNFEIDFSDINSYEQIQLINDTQLAKENLLMHRAYKEPADDAIIRNQFSSFTFVDFCPKLFSTKARPSAAATTTTAGRTTTTEQTTSTIASGAAGVNQNNSNLIRHYELETFSDLFERINKWLYLNKDWRVVSMETLVFDCTTQFNHLKSSIHQNYLPKNTRGLRLFLSPSKSRFSGPQKIGCINIVPRKVSGSYLRSCMKSTSTDEPVKYENLDQILARLNELLLTRPIEGRILSVETITLPIVNGYVNTEANYYLDDRLNSLYRSTYTSIDPTAAATAPVVSPNEPTTTRQLKPDSTPMLIDILRVYYEFGPMVCGLVNLIDFVPRFYSAKPSSGRQPPDQPLADGDGGDREAEPADGTDWTKDSSQQTDLNTSEQGQTGAVTGGRAIVCGGRKIAATESLTRLIRRSLTWFEAERKRTLAETQPPTAAATDGSQTTTTPQVVVNLKACNLQVHHKILLKSELIHVNAANALERIDTRSMAHERPVDRCRPITCAQCSTSTSSTPVQEWCLDLIDLSQAYEVKFVRLAYVVPVKRRLSSQGRVWPAPARPLKAATARKFELTQSSSTKWCGKQNEGIEATSSSSSSSSSGDDRLTGGEGSPSSTSSSSSASASSSPASQRLDRGGERGDEHDEDDDLDEQEDEEELSEDELRRVERLLAQEDAHEYNKQAALAIINNTNRKHRLAEEAHQLNQDDDALSDAPIGQLTYRLFAPCQLVNSSSCFAINPVNSSNPLARRGSVDLNGAGLSSENAHPSSLLLGPNHVNSESAQLHSSGQSHHHHQQVISFGALFSSRSQDNDNAFNGRHLLASGQATASDSASSGGGGGGSGSKFITNEFESVEAIRRRMEVYVTTNSMKVIAGETLIVNLSDVLSCLSTAIEQTVIKASFTQRAAPSSWVSVYVLYAGVDEPPSQLLEQQRARDRLAQISEQDEEPGEPQVVAAAAAAAAPASAPATAPKNGQQDNNNQEIQHNDQAGQMVPVFEDDFKLDTSPRQESATKQQVDNVDTKQHADPPETGITIEQDPVDASLIVYNSAYDRTVPLPSAPDNQLGNFVEPNEFLGSQSDYTWLDGDELLEAQQRLHLNLEHGAFLVANNRRKARKSASKLKSKRSSGRGRRQTDSGCSLM